MRCPKCQAECPPNMKFCGECGTALKNTCRQCGAENPVGFKYCGECGSPLSDEPSAAIPAPPAAPEPLPASSAELRVGEGERRHLTVMFCDMVGSSALSGRIDAEDLLAVHRAYQETCVKAISKFGGYVAKYLGDGILVYFGYPQAHEDDARRAVLAGLEIVRNLPELNVRLQQTLAVAGDVAVRARVGIHTGEVVVSDVGNGEFVESSAIVGETPNIAARLQELTPPDSVVVSGATWRLAGRFFECNELGTQTLRGIRLPVTLHQIVGETTIAGRAATAAAGDVMPLVGREKELSFLDGCWQQAADGLGQVVLLNGEAGIGKSRLLQAFRDQITADGRAAVVQCVCSPYNQESAFYAVLGWLQQEVLSCESGRTPQEKLELFLTQRGLVPAEAAPLLAFLLALQLDEQYPPLSLAPEARRQRTLAVLLRLLLPRPGEAPVLLVVEDLHWVDASTLELLDMLVDQAGASPIFALFTCRPEFDCPWSVDSNVSRIRLNRLVHSQVQGMVERLAGGKSLPPEVLAQVVAKTDGVPLFVEELTKMVLESNLFVDRGDHYELTGPIPDLAIPTTLHDSLMARLDRLAPVKEVAQLAAALGTQEFSYALLRAAARLDDDTLQSALTQLVEAQLLLQQGRVPEATFSFKHALVRDTAYGSLLKGRRQQYHQWIALALEQHFPELVTSQPELLAYHFTEANQIAKGVDYWNLAGERAVLQGAHREAITQLTRGLDLLRRLPLTPERHHREIEMEIRLGVPLQAVKGYSAPEVEATYARARQLCQETDDTISLFPVLYGLLRYYQLAAEYDTACELGDQLQGLAKQSGNPGYIVAANRGLAGPLFYQGEHGKAITHLQQVLAIEATPELRQDSYKYDVVDPWITAQSYLGWSLWLRGYPDQAAEQARQALATAESVDHPFSVALALSFGEWVHQFRGDIAQTLATAERALAISRDLGFAFWIGWGEVLQGWTVAQRGDVEAAIEQMRGGLADWNAQGSQLGRSYFLAMLAEACALAGRVDEGLEALDEAQEFEDRTGEGYWAPEIHRLRGDLLIQRDPGGNGQIQACFDQALEVALAQGAKSLELRAAMSLCRLGMVRGETEAHCQLLRDTRAWFTEGADTRDLKEADKLLAELA
ncbi:MAG: AAA family ATPase [Armatimonadetes bacterium]|nr:AAA family ATPase [Armatimonadota bacterium]